MNAGHGLARCAPVLILTLAISGCGGSGTDENFSRSDDYTDILSQADLSAPTALSEHIGRTLQGTATYDGVAAAEFDGFTGTADAELVVDFDRESISGRMTDWVDGNPLSHELRGELVLSNGTLRPEGALDGTFAARVTGNLERSPLDLFNPDNVPVVLVIGGEAWGAFHDSESGEIASHVQGAMAGTAVATTGGEREMTGSFVAER